MRVVVVGALYGAVAVSLGAVGAHVFADRFPMVESETFKTAVFYLGIHAVALVAIGAMKGHVLPVLLGITSWLMGIGVLLFSGSLIAATLGASPLIVYATPIGGVLLILGWLMLAVAAARRI